MLTICAFVLGSLIGWRAPKARPAISHAWPVVLRTQILMTSTLLGLVSAWRLHGAGQLLDPLVVAGVLPVGLAAALLSRRDKSMGEGALEAWATGPNGGYWVIPVATAFAGAAGAMIAVLANTINSGLNAFSIHLMRRDAPRPQRRATSWIDQSPVMGALVGLALHLVAAAPSVSADILSIAGPLLALSGAALFAGSALHPHNQGVDRTGDDFRRFVGLSAVRALYFVPVVILTHNSALAVVCVLTALSAPAFQPVQQSILYGYRSPVVHTAARWGWVLAPLSLAAAAIVR